MSAEELPKALGIIFGGQFEDVRKAYPEKIPSKGIISDIFDDLPPRKQEYYSIAYDYPLVNLRDAGKITYYVFRGKVYSSTLEFNPTGEANGKRRSQEIKKNLTFKYGEPILCNELDSKYFVSWILDCWKTNNLQITYSTVRKNKKNIITLTYTYLPLEKAFKEYLRQEEIDGL